MIKYIAFTFMLLSGLCAQISEIDTDFIKYSEKYINDATFDKALADEVSKIQSVKDYENLKNNKFDLETYKKQLGDSYEEAFKKQAKENIDKQLSKYADLPEVQQIKKELYSKVDTQSIQQMANTFKDLKYSIPNPFEDDAGGTIEVFNGDSVSSSAGGASNSKTSAIQGFSCLCAGSLSSAFREFDRHYNENLSALQEQLKALNETVEANTEDVKANFKSRDIINIELEEHNVLLRNWIQPDKKTQKYLYSSN